jgi:hypothetical protein
VWDLRKRFTTEDTESTESKNENKEAHSQDGRSRIDEGDERS